MSIEERLRQGLAGEASAAGVEEALEATYLRRRTSLRRRIIGGVIVAAVLAVALPSAMQLSSGRREPVTAAAGAPAGFEGSWVSHLSRRQVVHQIKAAGLGQWVKPFLAHEQLTKHQTFVYSLDGDRFKVADFEKGGGWHVGWQGSLTALPGQRIRMHDDFSGATDVYSWRRDGNRLQLVRVRSDTPSVYDIPYQVYDAAYLGDWWDRTRCAMRTGQNC